MHTPPNRLRPSPQPEQFPVQEPVTQTSVVPGEICPPTAQIANPGLLLNTALIPISAILSGVALLVFKRMRARLPKAQGGGDVQETKGSGKHSE